ncbi:MAG: hypothetical protein U0984_18885 [Prosthecobacter sp.]|nr:hypothetical protein [Prosthecobacter sp.]
MKTCLLLCLTSLLFTAAARADQAVSFPHDKPIIDLAFPDDWKLKPGDGALFAHPEDDAGFFMALSALEATSADPKAAVAEVKEDIEALYKNVKYQEPETTEAGDIDIMLINAKGKDEDGVANINVWMIAKKGEETLLVLKCISSQEAFEKHAEVGGKIIGSIVSHGKKAAAVQHYSYPNKESSKFSVDFPADWKVEADEKGAFVVSADKMFTVTILAIDTEHIMDATESIGKSVTARYASVVWNGGGKPTTKMDDATGMTLTANEGIAKGTDGSSHKLGLYQFAKVGSDKFFVLNTWAPEKAVEANAEGILMMLSSIKLK